MSGNDRMGRNLIAKTGNVEIYCNGEDDDTIFAVKKYKDVRYAMQFMEREKKISHEIYAKTQKREAVIPILDITEDGCGRMMLKKHGHFLNDLIPRLEDRYESSSTRGLLLRLDIIKEILISLDTIHFCGKDAGNGYVHLDIHPGNIFFENTDIEHGRIGTAKFLDFLSARPVIGNRVLQDDMEFIIASPVYAAQEYLEGTMDAVCRTTDLYSVGKIFCRMLFRGPVSSWEEDRLKYSKAMIEEKLGGSLKANIIAPFIQCALDSNPKYRYQTVGEMRQIVEEICAVLQDCENMDYDKVLSYLFEQGFFEKQFWIKELKFDERKLMESAKHLKEALLRDNINSSKCYYIYIGLQGLLDKNKNEIKEYGKIKNQLLVSGVSCCNYTGRSNEARELYEELRTGEVDMDLQDYLVLLNRTAVSYADSLDYEGAYRLIEQNIASLETIKRTRAELVKSLNLNTDASKVTDMARAYSAKGCYMVLCGLEEDNNNKTPLYYFDRALEEFGEDCGNRRITTSHILQYAIEKKERNIFEKYASKEDYFGMKGDVQEDIALSHVLKDLLIQRDPYVLHVFLKGVYNFYLSKVDNSFLYTLKSSLSNELLDFEKNNPMELVFRWAGLIIYEKNGHSVDSNVLRAYDLAMSYVPEAGINPGEPINILTLITYQTRYQYNKISGQDNEKLYEEFMEHCKCSGNKRVEEIYKGGAEKLNEVLTFEYV